MFASKTLFIVGAGASKEAKLPTGAELKDKISKKLCFRFEHFSQTEGDFTITDALKEHVRSIGRDTDEMNQHIHAARHIVDAMPQATSIDSFIDSHNGDERIELCGKLAIVQAILEAERDSLLFVDQAQAFPQLDYGRLAETWYDRLMKMLYTGCRKENVHALFENVFFIIFNYDRCIEHFLHNAVQIYYGVDAHETAKLVESVTIIHPYGMVGRLPWQTTDKDTTGFGSGIRDGRKLLSLAGQIKTFTERVEDEETMAAMKELVRNADTIVFLGFAFHPQNMELIKVEGIESAKISPSGEGRRAFFTTKGVSDSDRKVIGAQIRRLFGGYVSARALSGLTCRQLFDEYSRSLPS